MCLCQGDHSSHQLKTVCNTLSCYTWPPFQADLSTLCSWSNKKATVMVSCIKIRMKKALPHYENTKWWEQWSNRDYQKLSTNVSDTLRPPLLKAPPDSPTQDLAQGPCCFLVCSRSINVAAVLFKEWGLSILRTRLGSSPGNRNIKSEDKKEKEGKKKDRKDWWCVSVAR